MKMTIMAVIKDSGVSREINRVLSKYGMHVIHCTSEENAADLLKTFTYDMMITCCGLDDMHCIPFIQKIRSIGYRIPVLMLCKIAKKEVLQSCYASGIDDYVLFPCSDIELVTRVSVLHDRKAERYRQPPFRMEDASMIFRDNHPICLSEKEMGLMKFFMMNTERIVTKAEIYREVWQNSLISENSVMVYINYLRKKIETDPGNPVFLKTIRGSGYCFFNKDPRRTGERNA